MYKFMNQKKCANSTLVLNKLRVNNIYLIVAINEVYTRG